MAAYNFYTGVRFQWEGKLWEIVRTFPDNRQYNLETSETGETKTVSYQELVDALFAGSLSFIQEAVQKNRKEVVIRYKYTDLRDAPLRLQLAVKFRVWVIEPLLDLPKRSAADIKARAQEVTELARKPGGLPAELRKLPASQRKCSQSSIYRWIKIYLERNRDRRALIDDSEKRGGGARLKEEVNTILMETIDHLYMCRTPENVSAIWLELNLRIKEYNEANKVDFKTPSVRTVNRRIHDIDSQEVIIVHQGKRVAQQYSRQYRQTLYPTRPLSVVEIDDTKLDLIVLDENTLIPIGRPTLVYCLDRATRYPLGFYLGFEPSSYLTAMECLYHVIHPKIDTRAVYGTQNEWLAYGIPDNLIVDNAFQYTGSDLEENAYDLGIAIVYAPARYPQFKAGVERFFRTSNQALVHTVPGTTFSNILKRGDYESKKLACVTLSDFNRILHRYLVDIYAQTHHNGLDGVPAQAWQDALGDGFFPRLPANLAEPTILLGRVKYRKPQSSGISIHSLFYNCSELGIVREHIKMAERKGVATAPGQKSGMVKVKYHPSDLSCIYVFDPIDKTYIKVPAKAGEYTKDLSLWQHEIIRRQSQIRRKSVNVEALARTKREIREEIEQSKALTKLTSQMRIARYESGGRSVNQLKTKETLKEQLLANSYSERGRSSIVFSLDVDVLDSEGFEVSDDLPR